MADQELQVIRPENAHNNATSGRIKEYPYNASPPPYSYAAGGTALSSAPRPEKTSLSIYSTTSKPPPAHHDARLPTSKQRWWQRRICGVPLSILLLITCLLISGIVVGAVMGTRIASPNEPLRSDTWYTLHESDPNLVHNGYLNDFTTPEKGKNVLRYPGNEVRERIDVHWQFLRINQNEAEARADMSPTCQDAMNADKGVYWLLNRAAGPTMRLGLNSSGFDGPTREERWAKDEMALRIESWSRAMDELWYVEARRGRDQYVLVNCDPVFTAPRRLGRKWDGTTTAPKVVLLKNNGTSSEKNTIWTVSSEVEGGVMRITEPGWESFE